MHLLNTPSEKEFEAGWLKPVLVVVHRDVCVMGELCQLTHFIAYLPLEHWLIEKEHLLLLFKNCWVAFDWLKILVSRQLQDVKQVYVLFSHHSDHRTARRMVSVLEPYSS